MIVKVLLWIWQLPQNIAGWIMTFFAKEVIERELNDGKKHKIYLHKLNPKTIGEAVTLGEYIFLDYDFYGNRNISWGMINSVSNHEYGHTKQSRLLGPLYIFVIGIPSIIHAAIHNHTCRGQEYEHFYTEKWADKWGNVDGKANS